MTPEKRTERGSWEESVEHHSLPFPEFVTWCARNRHPALSSFKPGRDRLWDFVREIRGWCADGVSPDIVFNAVDRHIIALGGWMQELGTDPEAAYQQFMHVWTKIRYPPGRTPIEFALAHARVFTITTERHNNPRPCLKYNLFVSVAGWLQYIMGDGVILLPCHKLAPILETDPCMVKIWRDQALEDRYIVVETPSAYRKKGVGTKATKFRFAIGRDKQFERWYHDLQTGAISLPQSKTG